MNANEFEKFADENLPVDKLDILLTNNRHSLSVLKSSNIDNIAASHSSSLSKFQLVLYIRSIFMQNASVDVSHNAIVGVHRLHHH